METAPESKSKFKSFIKQALTLIIGLFIFYTIIGLVARSNFLDTTKPFPTWTYDSGAEMLNVWTSWDSGFYYDIAKNSYPTVTKDVPVATIDIPANAWVKVFMGSGLLGEERFALPVSEGNIQVNNVVFLIGRPDQRLQMPLYYGYKGIPYCVYTGAIDYERDIASVKESLSNPTSCGATSCTRTYITYYHVPDSLVLYQEYFDKSTPENPIKTFGEGRHDGFPNTGYEGLGCSTVGDADLDMVASIDYETQFTPLPFMPLYSVLSKVFSFVVQDIVFAGLVISILSFIGSAVFLRKFLKFYFNENLVKYAVLSYMLFPFAFFNLAYLSVALFNMLFFGVLYFARANKPLLVAIGMLLLVLTNWFGILALIPVFYLYTRPESTSERDNSKGILYFVIASLASVFALIGHILYLNQKTGSWLTLLTSRKPWYGDTESFVGSFVNYFIQFDKYVAFEIAGLAILGVIVYLGITYIQDKHGKKLGNEFISMASFMLLIPLLSGGITGYFKYSFMLVPLFIFFGNLIEKKGNSKVIFIIFIILGTILMSLWTISSRFVL